MALQGINGKGPDPEDGAGGDSDLLPTQPTLSHSSHLHWRHQPAVTLEIWLDQKPVHHCCPVEDGPVRFWPATFTASDDNSL